MDSSEIRVVEEDGEVLDNVSPQKKTVLIQKFKSKKRRCINYFNEKDRIDLRTRTGLHTHVFKRNKYQKYCVLYNMMELGNKKWEGELIDSV